MKKLQQFCAAMALTLTLTLSGFAGEMSTPGIAGMPGATAAGEILTPGLTELDPVMEAALNLLGSLLSLF